MCEKHILSKLRSPSTYRQVSTTAIELPFEKPTNYHLTIEYDAANAFGTPVRDRQICIFALKNGKPDTSKYYDFDNDLGGGDRELEQAVSDAENAADAADAAANAALKERHN